AESAFEIRTSQSRNSAIIDHSADPQTPATNLSCAPVTSMTTIPPETESPAVAPPTTTSGPAAAYDSSPDIKLSEILPNPEGDDSGHEAVELNNTGTNTVRLDGWFLDDATTTNQPNSSAYGLSGSILPGQFLLIV